MRPIWLHPDRPANRSPFRTVLERDDCPIALHMPRRPSAQGGKRGYWLTIKYGVNGDAPNISESLAARLRDELDRGLAELDALKRTHAAGAPSEPQPPQA